MSDNSHIPDWWPNRHTFSGNAHRIVVRRQWQAEGRDLEITHELQLRIADLLTASGGEMSQGQARDQAWGEMCEKYPPLPPQEPDPVPVEPEPEQVAGEAQESGEADAATEEDITELPVDPDEIEYAFSHYNDAVQVSFAEIVLWVFNHLHAGRDRARSHCPTPGCFSFWVWARNHQKEFYEKFVTKAIAQKKREDEERKVDDGKELTKLCETIKAEFLTDSLPVQATAPQS